MRQALAHTVEVARGFARRDCRFTSSRGVWTRSSMARGTTPRVAPRIRWPCTRRGRTGRRCRRSWWPGCSPTGSWRRSTTPPYGPGYQGDLHPALRYFARALMIAVGRLSHGVLAGTEEAKRLLAEELRVPRERIGVLAIGVDIDYFHPLDRAKAIQRAGLDPGLEYLLFVGHLASWVDFDTLLRARASRQGAPEHPPAAGRRGAGASRHRGRGIQAGHRGSTDHHGVGAPPRRGQGSARYLDDRARLTSGRAPERIGVNAKKRRSTWPPAARWSRRTRRDSET